MDTSAILTLLKNSGFHTLGADRTFIYLEDPSCILRSFEIFIRYAWAAITVITAFLLMGWAISMIRGIKNDITYNLRSLVLIFGILSAAVPIINTIYGSELFAKGCRTIKVPIAEVDKLLQARNLKLKKNNHEDSYEYMDIYDSKFANIQDFQNIGEIPYSELPVMSAGEAKEIPVSVLENASNVITAAVGKGYVVYTNKDGTKYKKTGGTLAWRNNNIGNVENTPFMQSHGALNVPKSESRFAVFPDRETGRKALIRLLREGEKYKNNTIKGAMESYAPPTENDTVAYYNKIKRETGIPLDTKLSSLTNEQLSRIVAVIEDVEDWRSGKTVRIN